MITLSILKGYGLYLINYVHSLLLVVAIIVIEVIIETLSHNSIFILNVQNYSPFFIKNHKITSYILNQSISNPSNPLSIYSPKYSPNYLRVFYDFIFYSNIINIIIILFSFIIIYIS